MSRKIPVKSYGVTEQETCNNKYESVIEQVKRLGYAILDGGYTEQDLDNIRKSFNNVRDSYIAGFGESYLREIDEYNTIRALLTHGDPIFIKLATNQYLLQVLERLIAGKFILNQQNGVINPPEESYNQAAWHRDLPYQHYVSSSPLAVNALFCVDDFTHDNGATFVIPFSHKFTAYPSDNYVQQNAVQITAKAGQFIILDCMLFHSGGFNKTSSERRAVNQVFTIPYIKQQINLWKKIVYDNNLTDEVRALLGADYQEPESVEEYLFSRLQKHVKAKNDA